MCRGILHNTKPLVYMKNSVFVSFKQKRVHCDHLFMGKQCVCVCLFSQWWR